MNRRVVVTGAGVIAPRATGTEEFWNLITSGRTASRTISTFDPRPFRSQVAAECDFVPHRHGLTAERAEELDRATQFALAAASQAIADSGLTDRVRRPDRTGVSIGNAVGCTQQMERQYLEVSDGGRRWRVDADRASEHFYDYFVRYRSPTRIPSFVSRIQTPAASSSGRRKRCNDSHMVWACFRYPERRADLMAADARRILSSKTREPRFRVDCPGVNATREEKPPAGGGRGPGTLRKGFEAGWNPGRGWDDTPAVGSRGTRDAAGSPSASRENRSGEACALVHAGSVAAALTLASALGRTAASRRRPPAPSCCGWRRDGGAGEQPGEGASWTARSRTDRVDQLVGAEHPRWRGPRWWTSPVRRGLGPAPQRGKEPRLSRLA